MCDRAGIVLCRLWKLSSIYGETMQDRSDDYKYSPTSIIRTSIIRTLDYPNSRSEENAGSKYTL